MCDGLDANVPFGFPQNVVAPLYISWQGFEYNENLIVFPGLEKLQEWYLTKLCNASTSFTVGHFDSEMLGLTTLNLILDIKKMLTYPNFYYTQNTLQQHRCWSEWRLNTRNNPQSCLWISRLPSYITAKINIAVSVDKCLIFKSVLVLCTQWYVHVICSICLGPFQYNNEQGRGAKYIFLTFKTSDF